MREAQKPYTLKKISKTEDAAIIQRNSLQKKKKKSYFSLVLASVTYQVNSNPVI